jgi:hypothetical protein
VACSRVTPLLPVNPRARNRHRFTDEHRTKIAVALDRRVDVRGENDCWEWTGSRLPRGYGSLKFNVDGKAFTVYAHRGAFDRANGYLPRVVRHTCDNPPCCNPNHLLGGSHKDNTRDMIERGRARHAHGSAHSGAKLTEEQVLEIRAAQGKHSNIARRYGIDTSSVTRIKSGEAWKHLEEELPPRQRGRGGARNSNAKLTVEQVDQIRWATGRQIDIAERFGTTQSRVSAIKTGRSWRPAATTKPASEAPGVEFTPVSRIRPSHPRR